MDLETRSFVLLDSGGKLMARALEKVKVCIGYELHPFARY